jgi:SAM-dependent methyltransferase
MAPHRNAGAPRLIDWTGERCVPWAPAVPVIYEHFHRYLWAEPLVQGRRVLDLGSGEGFGAAILAQSAEEVIGLDVDPRTVEHSQLNYARDGLSFSVGSATDLSRFPADSFGAVVAFEMIEHLDDHRSVLSEVARVLADDGILVISTPDRRLYTEASGARNEFHVHELSLDELSALLGEYFASYRLWGQQLITGSHIGSLEVGRSGEGQGDSVDFFIERTGEEWRVASSASPMYLIGVASARPLGDVAPALSTLADPGVELIRVKDEAIERLAADIDDRATQIADLHGRLAASEVHAAGLRHELDRYERSVTIQSFVRISNAVYGVIGRDSTLGLALQKTLRAIGRLLSRNPD